MPTSQSDKIAAFKRLHHVDTPLLIYNVWDAGSAKALADASSPAVGTSSWAVAAAQGYEDGEFVPLDVALQTVERIIQSVDIPVTVDFEGGYAESPEDVGANARRLIDVGIAGLNFEDRVVHGDGLYTIELQAERIAAIRKAADDASESIFINARTDIFLQSEDHASGLSSALDRAAAYKEAGADGFFVPGLADPSLIKEVCDGTDLPVNVMVRADPASAKALADTSVSRISLGPFNYFEAIETFKQRYKAFAEAIS